MYDVSCIIHRRLFCPIRLGVHSIFAYVDLILPSSVSSSLRCLFATVLRLGNAGWILPDYDAMNRHMCFRPLHTFYFGGYVKGSMVFSAAVFLQMHFLMIFWCPLCMSFCTPCSLYFPSTEESHLMPYRWAILPVTVILITVNVVIALNLFK